MRLTPFSKRALAGVATGGVLAAGLLVHVASAAEYACPTYTDPAADTQPAAPAEPDVDITAVTYTVVDGRFQAIIKLAGLKADGPDFGTGDVFQTTFTVAEKAVSFKLTRDATSTTTATVDGKTVPAAADVSTTASTVTLSAAVADMVAAAGVPLTGEAFSLMKAFANSTSPLDPVQQFKDTATASADAVYLFGDVCGTPPDPSTSPTDPPSGEPSADPSASPTDTPTDTPSATSSATPSDTPTSSPGVGGFVAMPQPVRVLDTRPSPRRVGPVSGPVRGDVPISLSGQITSSATAAVLNVTVVGSDAPGNLVVHRGGTPDPGTSSLNWAKGATQANEVTAALDDTKQLVASIHSNGRTHLVVDLVGYITADPAVSDAGTLTLTTPARIFDHAIGEGGTRITVPSPLRPAGTRGVLINITLVTPRVPAYLSVYAGDKERPNASTVNATPAQTQSNETLVAVDSNGSFFVDLNVASARVVVDMIGTYGDQTADSGTVTPRQPPQRVLDTRRGFGGTAGKRFGGSSTPITLPSDAPTNAVGVVLEVTTAQATEGGYLVVHPGGSSRPGYSTMNLTKVADRAHQVVVALGTGKPLVSVVGDGASTHLVVDVVGYVTRPAQSEPGGTPSPTDTPTDTPAPTDTPTDTPAPTDTPTDTASPTPSPTPTCNPGPKPICI